jgi:hypothetical protein
VGPGRPVVVLAALLGLLAGGCYAAWKWVEQRMLAKPAYVLQLDDVEITPLPPWIHTDIRAEVMRGLTLEGPLSIMDERLTQRAADAFALHPWIAKVRDVRKSHPAHLKVDLEYRQPVLMVDVPGGLLPVDLQGAWLPSGDFSPVEAARYPRLANINSVPVGPVGTRWGDARVVGAAEIAAALGPAWQTLQFDRIVASADAAPAAGEQYSYELFTRGSGGGSRVLWGHSPGASGAGEVPAAERVARLTKYAGEHGTLEGPHGPQQFDVRGLRALLVAPRSVAPQSSP